MEPVATTSVVVPEERLAARGPPGEQRTVSSRANQSAVAWSPNPAYACPTSCRICQVRSRWGK